MNLLERNPVKNVRNALSHAGLDDTIIQLKRTARSAEDAAESIGCELGAIVKSLVFKLERQFVLSLVAGDRKCLEIVLPNIFDLNGTVERPKASKVKKITGFSIGGVAPIGMRNRLPTVIDASFSRFDTLYAAAGHPHCVFSTNLEDLALITSGVISDNISKSL